MSCSAGRRNSQFLSHTAHDIISSAVVASLVVIVSPPMRRKLRSLSKFGGQRAEVFSEELQHLSPEMGAARGEAEK